jgi:hypothetical protein
LFYVKFGFYKIRHCCAFWIQRTTEVFVTCIFCLAHGKEDSLPCVFILAHNKVLRTFVKQLITIFIFYTLKIVPLHTQHVVLHVKIWHLSLFAILNQLIAFKVISESSQFWTTSASNNKIKWMQKDYSWYLTHLRPFPWNEKKFWTSWPGSTTTTMCSNDLEILKNANEFWKL